MRANQSSRIDERYALAFEPEVKSVSEFVEREIQFAEPGATGAFSFVQREYMREPIDCWGDDSVTDVVICFPTRAGKTRIIYAGMGYRIIKFPSRILYVKPSTKGPAGAESDARTRFIPMCRASRSIAQHIPYGSKRHDFKTPQQIINGSIVDWTGSNSVAQLASNPCSVVCQDEVDKFGVSQKRDEDGRTIEADPITNADERTGETPIPKRFKVSTPTVVSGPIWQWLLKTDLRRRFVPCPHCGRENSSRKFVIAWSKGYSVLPTVGLDGEQIPIAYVKWDEEARKMDGTWDLERVERSARYECPFCAGHVRAEHQQWMDKNGIWTPTKIGSPRMRGYHLPAMYVAHESYSPGALAVQFLNQKKSVNGTQGFVNSKLAEPQMHQGISADRKGLVGQVLEVTAEWFPILSVDFQEVAPYFWAIVRTWNGKDQCHGLAFRALQQWHDVDDLQAEFKIHRVGVIIDEGFNQSEVHRECANIKIDTRAILGESVQGQLPEVIGWTPAKSFGGKRLFREQETGLYLPYRSKRDIDPYRGTELAKMMRIECLEWMSDAFEDMMENIRSGKTGLKWTIAPEMDIEDYHKHMAGKVRRFDKKGGYKWETVRQGYPDHGHVCETMNLVLAYRLQLISFDAIVVKERKEAA